MKKIIKNQIFTFILGALIFGGIVGVSAYTIFANDIGYTPKDRTWKKKDGSDITNVKDAIDELYNKVGIHINKDLLWTNENPTAAFAAQSISLDLSNYSNVIIETLGCNGIGLNDELPNALNIVSVGYSSSIADRESNDMRRVTVSADSIVFDHAKYGQYNDNGCVIPYKIYGINNFEFYK